MTITTLANSLKAQLNGGNINELQDILRYLKVGNILRSFPAKMYGVAPTAAAVNPYVVATAQAITLPDDAKAEVILSAIARTGTGSTGVQLVNDVQAATEPAAGHCKVAPNGDLLFQHTDAWTLLDITYLPDIYDLYEYTLPVVPGTGILTLPAGTYATGLLEAQALTGTTVGAKIVQMHSTAPSTGQASINGAGTQVLFATADAVTSARVKIGVKPAIDVNALLEAAGGYLG